MLENVLVLKSYTILIRMNINLAYMCVRQRIALSYEGLLRWRGRFRLGRVDPLEEGRSTVEGVAQSVYVDTASCYTVGRFALWRARRGLKLSLCLVGIDYEMPEFDSDDLVVGSGPCPSNSTVALCVSLHSVVEAVLMCLDLLRLPSCVRNPYVEITKTHTCRLTECSHSRFPYHVFSSDELRIDRGMISR
ncbi:hypothetical protein M9H77_26936 [Catharanthus roseus]|uniref:Uncharacterized protein n=1 Tax=Catharanthus roseus TaxID=4058 RepID=A0ACC0ADS8_CATRO|nr:hypothetical protein M9H77_26936 [Catharanthus roseus]